MLILERRPSIGVAERLDRKGGREIVARCPDRADAEQTAKWLSTASPGWRRRCR
jgi:hypothetical protein